MSWFFYQLSHALLLLIAAPFLLARRGRHYLQTIPSRLGYPGTVREPSKTDLWIHAVSVGEVGVATAFASRLRDDLVLVATTITPTGQAQAQKQLGSRALVTYLPFDLGFAIRRFMERFSPPALILVEGDLWPLLLRTVKRRRMPVVVINGRVSDRGFARLRLLGRWVRPLLEPVDCFAVQSDLDRQRLLDLGVPPSKIAITGNLKFDIPEPERFDDLEADILRLAGGRPILIAGSTMEGEETIVLEAHRRLAVTHATLLLLAPRHPERWPEVAEQLGRDGLGFRYRSAMERVSDGPPTSILLLDTLGELAGLYAIADAAFVGGTLVDTGGHNPLEPSRFAIPTVVGPSMHNFLDISRLFDEAEAWVRVWDSESLASCWRTWLDEPQRATEVGQRGAELFQANQGAVEETIRVASRFIPGLSA